jgi:two-component system, NtrC family, sensor kinase
VLGIRVWERATPSFRAAATLADEGMPETSPDEVAGLTRNNPVPKTQTLQVRSAGDLTYRVFAPVIRGGRLNGWVELVERRDATPLIAVRYRNLAFWMVAASVVLITLGIYLLFRRMIYRPIERLLAAMERVEKGDFSANLTDVTDDELGRLAIGYNKMLAQVRTMTDERELRRQSLEQKVAEATAELSERNAQLEDLNRELFETTRRMTEMERLAAAGQTAAQFAHEVGTPLNLISGHVQLLGVGLNGDERARQRIDTIGVQIERIERIVRSMLDRTRPEDTTREPVDLNALLERIFDVTHPALDARQVTLDARPASNLPKILGAFDRLQQVFINLINNALDAMPEGGTLTVVSSLIVESEASRVVVEVSDTGAGMPEAVRARAFDSFFTTKERGRGTGLGLVVARQIVREHDGDIEIQSTVGKGTTLRLTFPALKETIS